MVRNVGTLEASKHYEADKSVYKENLTTSYGFLTKDAAKNLQTMLKMKKLTEKFVHQTIQINISTILPIFVSNSLYEVKF